MIWYYLNPSGERIAVEDEDLPVLVGAGSIHARTLVWHKGQAEWLSCGEVKPELFHPGQSSLGSAEPGRSEVVALVRRAGIEAGDLRGTAGFLFVLAGAQFLSVVLLPVCWIPGVAGVRYLRAAACLDSARRTGELRSLQLYGAELGTAGRWMRAVIATLVLAIFLALAAASLIRFGGIEVPGWLRPASAVTTLDEAPAEEGDGE